MERRLCRPSWALAPACAPLASQNKAALGLSGLWHPVRCTGVQHSASLPQDNPPSQCPHPWDREKVPLCREPRGLCHLLCRGAWASFWGPWEHFVLSCSSDFPACCRVGLADDILGLTLGDLPGTVLRWPWQSLTC